MEALQAEGIPCCEGYVPLYRMKAIQDGTRRLKRFLTGKESTEPYPDCPVTEKACYSEGIWFAQTMLLGTRSDVDDIVSAVMKIKRNICS
jgi:hypothetical protein